VGTDDRRTFWKGCNTCGPNRFHRWWCPELRRELDFVTVVLTVGVAVMLAAWGAVNWGRALAVVGAFWIATAAIHIAQRRRGDAY
jgi:hypothetical protein